MNTIRIESGLLSAALAATLPNLFEVELTESGVKSIIDQLHQVPTSEAEHLAGELASYFEESNHGTPSNESNWFNSAGADCGDCG